MASPELTPEQQQRAEVLAEEGLRAAQDEIRQMAELLASKPDGQLLGGSEFQIRDLVHRAAARMIEVEVEYRQKKVIKAPAPPAPTARTRPSSKGSTGPKPS
jgi:hypothetical protein